MRTKYFLIYLGIGIAFLAASLWVLLSGGKNAKAIRTKYKLGGALLTTWALLSAATCGPRIGEHPEVLCYEMPCPTNEVSISDKADGDNTLSSGDIMIVEVNYPRCIRYDWQITDPDRKTVLQKGSIQHSENDYSAFTFEIKLQPGKHKGDALLVVNGLYPEEESPMEVAAVHFNVK